MDIGLAFPKDAQIKAWRQKAEDALVAVELWKTRAAHFEAALQKIADMDYRGNRPVESSIAFKALQHQSK